MSYFIYTDLISGFLDPKLIDPGSMLVHTTLNFCTNVVAYLSDFQTCY